MSILVFLFEKMLVVVGRAIFPTHSPIDGNGKIQKHSHIMKYAK